VIWSTSWSSHDDVVVVAATIDARPREALWRTPAEPLTDHLSSRQAQVRRPPAETTPRGHLHTHRAQEQ
jgi:hypothetical protein